MCYGYNKLASKQGAQEFYDTKVDEYDEAEEQAWGDYLLTNVSLLIADEEETRQLADYIQNCYFGNYYDVEDLTDWLEGTTSAHPVSATSLQVLGSLWEEEFVFPSEEEWISEEYISTLGDLADRCYDEARDEALGL